MTHTLVKLGATLGVTLGLVGAAAADSILVLKGEGRTDAATRAKVDAAVLELARSTGAQVSPGDITFSDAAAAVGCNPHAAACKTEIIEMLAVDEIAYATITSTPDGLEVRIHRVTGGGATRDAKVIVPKGQSPDKLEAAAPLFGGAAPQPAEPAAPSASDASASTTSRPAEPRRAEPRRAEPRATTPARARATAEPRATETRPAEPRATEAQPAVPGATEPGLAPDPSTVTEPPPPVVTRPSPAGTAPPGQYAETGPSRLQLAGMIGGGSMVLIGFLLWGEASDIQDEVDAAPTSTRAQLDALAVLEARGDNYAAWGNVLFVGGAIIGGISTYHFIKDRQRARAQTTARITPALFHHGAGIALTIGGSP